MVELQVQKKKRKLLNVTPNYLAIDMKVTPSSPLPTPSEKMIPEAQLPSQLYFHGRVTKIVELKKKH